MSHVTFARSFVYIGSIFLYGVSGSLLLLILVSSERIVSLVRLTLHYLAAF